ncbi:Sir2 histone deacetylase Hst2 [Kalmusia sp. IMI 367209]|nr:Sir2 histone deacetylase Hst2 [Kalmusia sp. IMI 367209]
MGNQTSWTHSMHSCYGEVVRLGPNRLSYINPQAWKDIYGHRTSGKHENPKDTGFFPPESNGEFSLLSIPDAQTHGRIRRVFSNAFSDKALKLQEPLIKKYVDQLIENMRRAVDVEAVPLDLEKIYNFATFDIMGDLTFGEPLGLLQQSKYTPWVEAVFGRLRSLTVTIAIMNYPLARYMGRWFMPNGMKEEEQRHFEHSAHRVNKRLEKDTGEKKPDIWSLILEKGTEHLTLAKMHANAALFMVAGTETTATILSGLTFYLLTNPEKMKKLVDEVRALSEDELTLEILPRLPYLNACFQEGLRVYPSVPNGFPREIAPGGNVICGEMLPAKTSVIVSQAAAYRSPLNFKDPDSFIPERWLPGTGFDTDRKDVLQPFSVGPRNCIGKKYDSASYYLVHYMGHASNSLAQSGISRSAKNSCICAMALRFRAQPTKHELA